MKDTFRGVFFISEVMTELILMAYTGKDDPLDKQSIFDVYAKNSEGKWLLILKGAGDERARFGIGVHMFVKRRLFPSNFVYNKADCPTFSKGDEE